VLAPERSRFEMAILDTNIMVSLLKDEDEAKAKIKSLEESGEKIATTPITAYELLKGAQLSSKSEENLAKVRELLLSLEVLGLSVNACEHASKIYKELRQRGKMIGEFDIIIAAIVKSFDEKLVSRDGDFKTIRGLEVINW
jgi:tRNA(fMet)-specific endonuclease VapC